jgi:hypothetical protein
MHRAFSAIVSAPRLALLYILTRQAQKEVTVPPG